MPKVNKKQKKILKMLKQFERDKYFQTFYEQIHDIKKIFIHQANMKMDDAIVKRLYRLYNKEIPKNILCVC